MAQFARPDADDNNAGAWTTEGGGSANLYQSIDEASASDADYVQSPVAPAAAIFRARLSDIEDPQSSTGHVVRYRYAKDAAGGATINLTVRLKEGAATRATWTHNDISETFTAAAQALSGAEADSITDYTNLFLEFEATQA
jgi:hypothetical protein